MSMSTKYDSKIRLHYDIDFKLEAVDFAETFSREQASYMYGVDTKRIREWCKHKERLLELRDELQNGKKRLDGGGRKPLDNEMEHILLDWIQNERDNGRSVTRRIAMNKAKEVYAEIHAHNPAAPAFKASKGWLENFLKRHNVSADVAPSNNDLPNPDTCTKKVKSDKIAEISRFVASEKLVSCTALAKANMNRHVNNQKTHAQTLPQDEESTNPKRPRKEGGGGRRPLDTMMEDHLLMWIAKSKTAGLRLKRKSIMSKAREIYANIHADSASAPAFKASKGWLDKFIKRHNVDLPSDIPQKSFELGEEDLLNKTEMPLSANTIHTSVINGNS